MAYPNAFNTNINRTYFYYMMMSEQIGNLAVYNNNRPLLILYVGI